MVHIDVLGPFAMRTEKAPIVFEARSAAAVVAFLTLAKGRAVSRDAVAAALWPGHDEAGARTNLRKALQRVRKALPDGLLASEGEKLRLESGAMETDLDRADRLHRAYLLAARQPEGIAALADEWSLRCHDLLAGWEGDWIEPRRAQASLAANDLGTELAQAQEAMGNPEAALGTWHALLVRVPQHAQALQNAIRLELQLRGREQAAELARSARQLFREDLGVEMPQELRRTIREVRSGGLEPVPPPDFLTKRSELYLLARMFESNLADNRTEALALLARECTPSSALAHPRSMLSLLTLALERTSGVSEERLKVARLTIIVASWAAQYDVAHRWGEFALQAMGPDHPDYGAALSLMGFLHFEQREYAAAREVFGRVIAALPARPEPGHEVGWASAVNNSAGLAWHLEEYGTAIAAYESILPLCEGRSGEEFERMLGSTLGNLCFVSLVMGDWPRTILYGRRSITLAEAHPGMGWVIPGPLGLALFMEGQEREGCQLIARSLGNTLREGMTRFNQIVLDYAVIALFRSGRQRGARCLLHAAVEHRTALRHAHSPAEAGLIRATTPLDPDAASVADNPLLGQSAVILSEWACEELGRLDAVRSAVED